MPTRRVFLARGGAALVTLGFVPSFVARTVLAAGAPRRAKRLVAVFQRGAVDGLNMVVPHGDPHYYAARPGIAIARPAGAGTALDLDGFFAVHPSLAPLLPLWQRQRMAVVHACGSPDPTRSHFDAQDYMETATPGLKRTEDGWLNRLLQARRPEDTDAASQFRGVALSSGLPRALQGRAPTLAVQDLGAFGIRGGATNLSASFEAEYAAAADRVLGGTGRAAFDAVRALTAADPGRYQPEHGAVYPRSPFGRALLQIAQLLKADVGLEVAFTEVGGWDTHVNQGAVLAARLSDFGQAIAAFALDLGSQLDDVVVLTMSEFGRAVAENGNRGTDHGHGNAMLVLGGDVRGGRVYGRWPGLSDDRRYEGRDLAVTTDFRDVFAEVVVRHLGLADAGHVFPGFELSPSRFPGLFA